MKQHMALLILGALILQREVSCETRVPRVAVIGGGISGASASYFLTEVFNETVDIDLYEIDNRLGGRLANIKVGKNEFEAGGTHIYPKSQYLQKFVKILGFEKLSFEDRKYGIWDGDDEFILVDWPIMSPINMFRRYGFEPYRFLRLLDSVIEDLEKIYELQDAGHSFENLTALLSALNKDFPQLLEISTKDYLLNMDFSEELINEYMQAAIEASYVQGVEIPIFVVFTTVAVSSDGLFSVKCGNKGVPEQLIYRNKNVNIVPGRITKIRNLAPIDDTSQYEVTYIDKDTGNTMTSNYDIVIIGRPLTSDQKCQIEFVGFPDDLVFPGSYQTTYVTFVKGDLNLTYFGLRRPLDGILTSNPNKTKISLLEKLDSVEGTAVEDPPVWKIFSKIPMETSFIHDMFSHVDEKKKLAWKAYPRYWTNMNIDRDKNKELNKFKLHDGLYHVNPIEWAASLMELNAIAARNIAILARNDFLQRLKDIESSKNLASSICSPVEFQ